MLELLVRMRVGGRRKGDAWGAAHYTQTAIDDKGTEREREGRFEGCVERMSAVDRVE